MAQSTVAKIIRNGTKASLLLAVIAAVMGKRKYKNAPLVALFKRWIGWLVAQVLPVPTPQIVSGKGSTKHIARALKGFSCKTPLVVTDKMLMEHGLVQPMLDSLAANDMKASVYDAVVPNPSSELVEEGHSIYTKDGCDCLVAFGGGSPMDVAKAIGAKLANPSPSIEDYQGFFMVNRMGLKPLPPLVAVPTTAGTGSETTVAAVITISNKNKKIAIADLGLVPRVAVLDPELLVKLPPGVTSATGMDALTHAVEAFLGGWSSVFSRQKSLSATEKIFKYLCSSYDDGTNLVAREAMLYASFEAGLAFTRANVGYVHAIAHQFGGMFHTAHGVANAMLLPHVLNFYIEDETEGSENLTCTTKFCELARAAGLAAGFCSESASASEKRFIARKFVDRIAEMNHQMNIPTDIAAMKASDVDEVATRALKEAHGGQHSMLQKPLMAALDLGYPVPKYMTHEECKAIISKCLPAQEKNNAEGTQ